MSNIPLPIPPRLQQQLEFIVEIDRLKTIVRQTLLIDRSRKENDAEHSWHLAMLALVLGEYAPPQTDLLRVVKMLLVHDLVEIDAGDTFLYDEAGNASKAEREQKAAERIFHLLPADQASELKDLWQEFEARQTPSALFASALDRLQPLLHNYYTQGGTWQSHNIHRDQVLARKQLIAAGSPVLWDLAQTLIDESVRLGYLPV
jgi:putative hydrolase of HD superfamily